MINWLYGLLLRRFFTPLLIANTAVSAYTVIEPDVYSEDRYGELVAATEHYLDLDDILIEIAQPEEEETALFSADHFRQRIGADFNPMADLAIAAKIKEDSLTGFRTYYMPSEVFLTTEEAKEDIVFFFDFMQNSYPGYHVFGGPAVFNPIKEVLLEQIETLEEPVTPFQLNDMLQEALYGVVKDRHFMINGEDMGKTAFSYWVKDLDFLKDNNGYYILDYYLNGKTYLEGCYLTNATEEKNLDHWMKPAVNSTGSVVYKISGEFPEDEYYVIIVLSDGSQILAPLDMIYTRDPVEQQPEQQPEFLWELSSINAVPVLTIHSFSPWTEEQFTHMDQLIETATILKKEPYFILDLRNNPGGNASYAFQWLVNFTYDEENKKDYAAQLDAIGYLATLSSETTLATYSNYWGDYDEWVDTFYYELRETDSLPGWVFHIPETEGETIPNDTVIFVLVNQDTTSAPEYFISYLNKLENVILMGESTGGMFHFGSSRNLFLPHSGIGIFSSVNLFMLENGQMIESTGYVPDVLWNPQGPVEDIVSLIQDIAQ